MPRPDLQERIERLRKKIAERNGNKVVIHTDDAEAIEGLKQTKDFANVCHVLLHTGRCCGIVDGSDFAYPCVEAVDPEIGFSFCCVEHQKTFERNLPESVVWTFYGMIATINIFRPELEKRFYTDWLPCSYMIIAKNLDKPLVIATNDDEEFTAFMRDDPHNIAKQFFDSIIDDVRKYRAFRKVSNHCETAFENAVCFKGEYQKVSGDVFILSPSQSTQNTPRSTKQSPRKSKQNTPRSNQQSPRPGSPSVDTPTKSA